MDLGFLRLIFYKGFSYKKEHGACISKFSGTLLQLLLGQAYSTALPNPYSSADPIAALMLATLPTFRLKLRRLVVCLEINLW